ncbi:MAG: adenosylmethionine--8-amino-7-oxononanoate transaminase [Phycisphaerae bacterium]|jgi:adenosylmethionine-8-amino-7-oxononanoate aminotransferase|nr:adenosylmethionine--8-amino-7-oxononanoate transaminase [Phycisphaerae bacterium]
MNSPADMTPGQLFELDAKYVWHPFTPMQQWIAQGDHPGRIIERAEGFELIDTHGQRFIDGFSSLWCNLHGHRVEQIDRAINEQLNRVAHTTLLGHASGPSIELARRLADITPTGLEKVFYSDSGATAVEIALKMAFQYFRNIDQPRRTKFIALGEGYHGDTIGSVSLGGIGTFHGIFGPLLFEATFVDSPNPYHHPAGEEGAELVLGHIEDILSAGAAEYCAIIVEPLVQGAGGVLTHPPGFLKSVRKLASDYDILLIVDEVATGFCRTGRMFACEAEGVSPDLMCLGKGLTGGYLPLAATLATQKIFDAFCAPPEEGKTFYHGHTFTGNALACAAANASIDLIYESKLLDSLDEKIEMIRIALAPLGEHPNVGDIRQCGMMAGVELVADRNVPEFFDPVDRVGAAVCQAALKRDIIIRPLGDVITMMPAPAMDAGTLRRLLTGVVETINEYFDES